jgi:ABC-type multidrug transport system fused ATPase/permease subunit
MVQCANPITLQSLLFDFIKQNKFLFMCFIILVLFVPLQNIGIPHVIGKITNSIQTKQLISKPFIMLIVIICVLQFGVILNSIVELKLFPAFQLYIRNTLISHLMHQLKTNYEELHTGKIIMHFHKLPSTFYSYFQDLRIIIIPQLLVYIFAIAYFSYYDIYMGIALFLLLIIVCFSLKLTINNCNSISKNSENNYNILNINIVIFVQNIVMQSFR